MLTNRVAPHTFPPAALRAAALDLCLRSVSPGPAAAPLEPFWNGPSRPSPLSAEPALPFTVACAVAAFLLPQPADPAAGGSAAEAPLLRAAAQCLSRVLDAVPSIEDPEHRSALLRALLPALCSAADATGSGDAATAALRACCAGLLGPAGTLPQRRTALAALVHFCDRLHPLPEALLLEPHRVPTAAAGGPAADAGTIAVSADSLTLITAVREALADPEPMLRKQALHILKASLGADGCMRAPWRSYLVLYEALDDYSVHLFTGAWDESRLSLIHPQDPAKAPAASAAEKKEKKGKKGGRGGAGGRGAGGDGQEEAEASAAAGRRGPPIDYTWVAVLWRRGHNHANPMVRRLLLACFGCRDWSAPYGGLLPESYAFGSLLTALQARD